MNHAEHRERCFVENAEIHRVFMAAKKHLLNPIDSVELDEIHQLLGVQIFTNYSASLFVAITRTAAPNTEHWSEQSEEENHEEIHFWCCLVESVHQKTALSENIK